MLAASSKLTGKDVQVLEGLLTNAAYAMEKEDSQTAISTMVAFIDKVKGYHAQGSLDDKQAQMLDSNAEAIIDLVKNPPKGM